MVIDNGVEFVEALKEKGIIPADCTRVVIDAKAGEPVMLYYDVIGSTEATKAVKDFNFRLKPKAKR